jgi:integrase
MRLTARTIATLSLPESVTDKIHFDDKLRGFGFRLRRSRRGDKVLSSWIVQYRRAGGTRRVTLGDANVVDCEKARRAAKDILAEAQLGRDPQAERTERRHKDRSTLIGIVDDYLELKTRKVRPKSLSEIKRYLNGDYFKPLHRMAIDNISRKDVSTCLIAIARKHSENTAALAKDALSAFFVWAMQAGAVEQNPVIGSYKPERSKGRNRVLSNAELVAVWRACEDDTYGKIVRLLILTGARRQEIGSLRWSELDPDLRGSELEPERRTWTLPSARAKNERALTLSLPPAAWAIIDSVPREDGREHLFGARGFTGWAGAKAALDKRLGEAVKPPFVIHDLRRTVATRMADIGIPPHIIETIQNHHSGHKAGVAGVYNRSSYEREVRNALAIWADHIRSLVAGEAPQIIPFKQPSAS